MTFGLEIALSILLVVGGLFGLTGSYGLIRLKDRMQRLHAPTKASTVGLGTALLASMFHGLMIGTGFSWQEVLVMIFIFVTAPITANYLSKVHLQSRHYDGQTPTTGVSRDWATFDTAPQEAEPLLPSRDS
ncbi:MAG: monovalent cation/H(+) antiporter subunit G [Fuscovulum sp.]|jgi:multicomponent K+:H+ antiporter subunit G|nr:monovalent cation/H(+) antiporter subunit G [Paracoccaceae bacterium]MCZ8085280.1 monovalent cation/H(+) antiporter subunit G [Paracoccaceae bacterium]WRH62396.1 MAG: monovalent cation/H(+) antiporter subunit G [Fuscovulum sp.]